jgi:anti-sigma regulatory factor (Ser/Thr protein kinase)
VELPAETANLPRLLEFAGERIRTEGFDEETAVKLELAVEEILANIISYAYPGKKGAIELTVGENDMRGFVIEIGDSGIPFDPLSVPEADTRSPLEERKIGGLGIFFMRKVVDVAHYRYENGKNILILTMYRLRSPRF